MGTTHPLETETTSRSLAEASHVELTSMDNQNNTNDRDENVDEKTKLVNKTGTDTGGASRSRRESASNHEVDGCVPVKQTPGSDSEDDDGDSDRMETWDEQDSSDSDEEDTDSLRIEQRTLHRCAIDGDEAGFKDLVEEMKLKLEGRNEKALKEEINKPDEHGVTPLHYAARYSNPEIVKLIVYYGIEPNPRDRERITPLHYAARASHHDDAEKDESAIARKTEAVRRLQSQEEVIGVLLSGRTAFRTDKYGHTPLHYAAMQRGNIAFDLILQFWVKNHRNKLFAFNLSRSSPACLDSPLNAMRNNQGVTVLHLAARHNHPEKVKKLIKSDVDHRGRPLVNLRAKDHTESTPLHYAAAEGNVDVVKELLLTDPEERQEMLADKDKNGNTCLHHAVENGHYDVAEFCLAYGSRVNDQNISLKTPLHMAAVIGNLKLLKLLLDNNAFVDPRDKQNALPLHMAARFNHSECVKMLLSRGADIDSRDENQMTALLVAVRHGGMETVDYLTLQGADFTAVDKMGKSVVFIASEFDKFDCLQALAKHKEMREIVNQPFYKHGTTPLHYASKKGFLRIVKCLLNNGAILDARREDDRTPLHKAADNGKSDIAEELLTRAKNAGKTIVNDRDCYGKTALHRAASGGHCDLGDVLIQNGADVSAKNCSGWTSLDHAVNYGHKAFVELLINNGAQVDIEESGKEPPLFIATRKGHADIVKLLIEHSVDITRTDNVNRNCLGLAIHYKNKQVAEAIIQSDHWADVLRNNYTTEDGVTVTTPMRQLIKHMPDVAEQVLDRCIEMREIKRVFSANDHEVKFRYEFLDDCFQKWMQTDEDTEMENMGTFSRIKNVVERSHEYKQNHPLMLMVDFDQKNLLQHSVTKALLRRKWIRLALPVSYLNFSIYCVFLTCLTGYILTSTPPFMLNGTDTLFNNATVCETETRGMVQHKFAEVGKYIVIVLSSYNLLRELIELVAKNKDYLTWESVDLDPVVFITAMILVIDVNDCQRITGYRYEWQWIAGTISIVLAWIDLIVFLQAFPCLAKYAEMMKDILYKMVTFILVFVIIIIAFALGFYCLLQNQDPFSTVWQSFMKTFVMMIGEMDYGTTFYDETVSYVIITYILFFFFIIISGIMIMNLLVGLAIDSVTESYQTEEQAALKAIALQVKFTLTVEKMLPDCLARNVIVNSDTFQEHVYTVKQKVLDFGSSGLSLSNILDKVFEKKSHVEAADANQVTAEKFDKLESTVKDVFQQLQRQNKLLEEMLKSRHNHIDSLNVNVQKIMH